MDEFELIRRYFARPGSRDDVRLGIGDDGAVTEVPPGRQLVSVLDSLVEGVHYPRNLAPDDIGYRAVAVNLSDMAAMGAVPAWMLLGLTLPAADPDWLRAFAAGFFAAADDYGVALIGGDTTRGAGTVISVQMSGHVAAGEFLTRSGARAGDAIYVSGSTGDAAAGLELLQQARTDADPYLLERFRRPSARVALGLALASIASAAIDVSDGLYADLARLLQASGTGGTIDFSTVPMSPSLNRYGKRQKTLSLALEGGDDYELCFTVAPAAEMSLRAVADRLGLILTRIGSVDTGRGLRCMDGGEPVLYDNAGYRHF